MTQILKVHGPPPNPRHIEAAARAIDDGKLVLVPTETGYCYVGDAARDASYSMLLDLRAAHPRHKPFSVLCSSLKQVSAIASLPTPVFRAASRLLPGPYTFLLASNRNTPQYSDGPKRKSVGIRMSSDAVAQAVAVACDRPLVITSVTDADELQDGLYFEGLSGEPQDPDSWWITPESILAKAAAGGKSKDRISVALEWPEFVPMRVSTVIDFTDDTPVLVRDGGWPLEGVGLVGV
jgi:tRNA threonylcarbamoyl adenosine modification protein (Sua5/YciO/YrdC/YwlC family)